jgi:hypothetical protein
MHIYCSNLSYTIDLTDSGHFQTLFALSDRRPPSFTLNATNSLLLLFLLLLLLLLLLLFFLLCRKTTPATVAAAVAVPADRHSFCTSLLLLAADRPLLQLASSLSLLLSLGKGSPSARPSVRLYVSAYPTPTVSSPSLERTTVTAAQQPQRQWRRRIPAAAAEEEEEEEEKS